MKPWEDKWQRLPNPRIGGQGQTFVVKSKEGGLQEAILKISIPRKEKNPKARRRMHVEVTHLKVLFAAGGKVPNVLDHNTDQYENLDIPLFFVMDYVRGDTLAEHVERIGGLDVSAAVHVALDLCSTLRVARSEGITHRDIKPENIIVRGSSPYDLVIVDFGLSFNDLDPTELTDVDEVLDNQFVSFPERRGPSENKRDPRTDLGGICAILHYCLTKCRPRNLRDSKGRQPHHLDDYRLESVVGNEIQRALLNALLDRGLQYEVDRRFQTLEELEERLREVLQPGAMAPTEDFAAVLERESAALVRENRASQIGSYHHLNEPFFKELQSHVDVLRRAVSQSSQFTIVFHVPFVNQIGLPSGDYVNLSVNASIKPLHHELFYVVLFVLMAQGEECAVYRALARSKQPHYLIQSNESVFIKGWTAVLRYAGGTVPDLGVLRRDLEASLAEAVKVASSELRSSGSTVSNT